MRAGGLQRLRAAGRIGLQQLELQLALLRHGMAECAADETVELVRAAARRRASDATSAAVSTCPVGRSRAATSFLPIFIAGAASLG